LLILVSCQIPGCIEKVLRELHKRKYAGEEIWLQTLSKDADISEADVKFALNDQRLGDWFSIKDGFGLVTVKDSPLLLQKLLNLGVEPESLQPMQARFRGREFRNVRQFRNCKRNEIGQLEVEAVWTSKEQPSRVLWQELNASAQENVCALFYMYFSTSLSRLQVAHSFELEPLTVDEADADQAHQITGVVGRKKGNGGVWVYGLQWKSQDSSLPEITWEPFDDLDAVCQDMVLTAFPHAATERWRAKSKGKQKRRGKKKATSQVAARRENQKATRPTEISIGGAWW